MRPDPFDYGEGEAFFLSGDGRREHPNCHMTVVAIATELPPIRSISDWNRSELGYSAVDEAERILRSI